MNCSDQLQCYAVPTYPTSIVVVRYFDTVGNRISNDPIVREKTQKNTGEKSSNVGIEKHVEMSHHDGSTPAAPHQVH